MDINPPETTETKQTDAAAPVVHRRLNAMVAITVALLATFMVFLGVLFLAYGWQQHQNIKSASYTFQKMKKQNYFCNELNKMRACSKMGNIYACIN